MTLIGVETGVQLSTVTNEAGLYRFDAVNPGAYNAKVSYPGFRDFSAAAVGVQSNRVTTLDPRLEVGSAEPGSKSTTNQRSF